MNNMTSVRKERKKERKECLEKEIFSVNDLKFVKRRRKIKQKERRK